MRVPALHYLAPLGALLDILAGDILGTVAPSRPDPLVSPLADAPSELRLLLDAPDHGARESAWSAFVAEHSGLLLRTCRLLGGGYDAAMDRYAYVLEQLLRDDFRRLRTFRADGRCKFTTWLVVIARRACLDYHRQRYGRLPQSDADEQRGQRRQTRRDLVELVSCQMDVEELEDPRAGDPEADLMDAERVRVLEQALGALEPQDRLLLRLRFDDELSAAEIARVMAFPSPFHVYRRLNGLFEDLRGAVRRGGIEGPAA